MTTPFGLDLSLTSTGFCSDSQNAAICSKQKGMPRLAEIRDRVLERVQETEGPVIIVEGYSFGSKNSQAHATGELGGVVRLSLYEASIPFIEVPPTCLKKFATGKGNASKNEVISAMSAKTGIVWSGSSADDMCDAFVLREMALTQLGLSQYKWNAVNLEGLSKVDWTNLIK